MLKKRYDLWEAGEYTYPMAFGFQPNIVSYLHEDTEKARPCVIVVPGGGYRVVSPSEGEIVAKKFYDKGYQTFVCTYTVNLTGTVPLKDQPVKDLARAVRYIRKNADLFISIHSDSNPDRRARGLSIYTFLNNDNNKYYSDMESIILKTDKQTIEIKDFKVELPAFYNNDSLLYSAQMQFTGLNALQNFFIYPDMFKFVRIYGIKKLFKEASESHGKLIFAFKKRRNELQTVIDNDSIMTNCLPVINIFKMKSSRGYTNDYYEYHIVPNNVAANDYEVYNIESINFYDNINNLLLTAKPFYYTDVEVQFNNNYDYFAIHRRPRSDGLYTNRSSYKGYEVFASISGEKWQEVRDEIVQYSADLICTNRDLPLYIKANTKVSFAASQIESGVFINAPTKPLNPLINSGRREDWEKINHIMLNLSNILWKPGEVPVKIIKNIIKSYSLLSKDDTERILTSIVSIESEPATFRYINGNNGIFYEQGWKINMVISESKINDIGFFTFACVLWQFFQSYIPINSHIEFNVYSESYGLLKQWIM